MNFSLNTIDAKCVLNFFADIPVFEKYLLLDASFFFCQNCHLVVMLSHFNILNIQILFESIKLILKSVFNNPFFLRVSGVTRQNLHQNAAKLSVVKVMSY